MRLIDLDTWSVRAAELGVFPALASHVVAVVSDPRSSAADVADVLAAEPAVGMRLVRLVNGPFYDLPRPIFNLRDVLVTVGLAESLRLVLAVSIGAQLWDTLMGRRIGYHALRVGGLARFIALRTPGMDPGDAFLAGCLHDAGMPIFSQSHPGYDAMAREQHGAALVQAEREALGLDHATLMASLLSTWGVAGRICAAVRAHHDPVSADSDPLAVVVQLADLIDSGLQTYQPTAQTVREVAASEAAHALEVKAAEIEAWIGLAAGRAAGTG